MRWFILGLLFILCGHTTEGLIVWVLALL